MEKTSTLIRMLNYICSKEKVTTSELMRKYGLSRRTTIKYIEDLSMSYVPIISEFGPHGGYRIADSYKIKYNFLTASEYGLLMNILGQYSENIQSGQIEDIISKFSSLSKSVSSENVFIQASSFYVDSSSWNGDYSFKDILSVLNDGIEKNLMVDMEYVDVKGQSSKRTLEPHVLILKQGEWYVYGYCHLKEDFRVFKLSRLKYVTLSAKTFERREYSLDFLKNSSWQNNLKSEHILLSVSEEARAGIEEWLGMDASGEKKDENGNTFFEADMPITEWLVGKIMSFGRGVKVLKPKSLVEKIREEAKAVCRSYE